ncbi:hemerythrin domain-containing protein [Amycolatopsis anabasis]|uniref:hemerythrin domain-containing protein n=1 Tax=Amycolatopsis anabasis TaxID=1840409 RepID=UPI00131CE109|nr:hemerythrin domain-containing protein [Amycolatopsis anabasis]
MPGDVVDLIMSDHREVERLFEELKTSPEKRPLLVPVVTALLTAHSRAEEAEVYPIARDEAGETDKVAHSQEEHAQAEQLMEQLVRADPQSRKFDQVLTELVEAVEHHVQEEESVVLPGMRERLSDHRREELGRAFAASRAHHIGPHPGEASKEELLAQARNAGISGASGMNKEDLTQQLRQSS